MRLLWLMAGLLGLMACKSKEQTAAGPAGDANTTTQAVAMAVETASIETRKMPVYLTLTGSVLAYHQTEVAANVSGRVMTTYVERGQPIKVNDMIAAVDSKAAGFQAAAAVAQSMAADSQVELAKQDCARADTLFAKGVLPKSEYERQKNTCTAQLYNANAARAQADLAGKLAGDTIIRSPINGIVGERFVNIGEYVQPPSRVASVFSINPVRISISVPEASVSQVREGQTLQVHVSAYPGRSFPAIVRFVSPALRASTRDLIVEAFAVNNDLALRPGMFATVQLNTGEEAVPTVPSEAIRVDGTTRRMFLAKEGQAIEMVVRTGVEKDGRIAVLDSFAPSERVIVKSPAGLRDGTAIR